jgi:hypothetical protein
LAGLSGKWFYYQFFLWDASADAALLTVDD